MPKGRRLVSFAVLLLVSGGIVAVFVTTSSTTSPKPKGFSVTLSEAETFFNARGTLSTQWTQGDNVTTRGGCSPFCGDRRELSGPGAACRIELLGPISNILGVILTCYPGQPAIDTNPTQVTNEAARALLSAAVERFAPSAVAWSDHELETVLGGPGITKTSAIHHDSTVTVEISSSYSYVGLTVRST
jgi:hypothetical protein